MNEAPLKSRWNFRAGAVLLLIALGVLLASDASVFAQQGQGRRQQQQQAAPAAPVATAQGIDYGAIMQNLRWRDIGPAIMGGRIDDFAVVDSDPSTIYVGTASGGVWKTTNAGTTWEPIFDDQEVPTIGDIAIAPSDPMIVWVGSGEPNNRQSSSWGNGIYKSEDGGRTWKNMGLRETQHIGRVVIHPTNPNIVYVAAVGHLWGPNKERGVYKTTDGGKTWTNILFINEDTGVIDIIIDPQSPDTLLAASYQRRRSVFGFNGSGPGSAIYKTTDAGATWRKLSRGLPYDPDFRPPTAGGGGGFGGGGGGAAALLAQLAGGAAPQAAAAQPPDPKALLETGRIGLGVYRRNSNIMYALIEHANGGIFRSEDKGETWTRMSETDPRPMYYSQVIIDPNNDLRIWSLGAPIYFSEDGGKTFAQNRGGRIHGDYHTLWIDPANSEHMLAGTDGGIHQTWDSGRNWVFINALPLGQFYEVDASMEKPYKVCGGLQDNGSWCAPAQTLFTRGITNDEWTNIGGGDGFYVRIDPTDGNILYSESQDGNLSRRNLATSENRSIRPREAPGEPSYRFQWDSPIEISAHDAKTIYYGGQYVFRSDDRGDTWRKISPDLTTGADRNKLELMGKVPDRYTRSRHDGVQDWPTITSIAESPRNPDVLWAGTDDGNLQVTRDGGKNWTNVISKVPGVQSKYIYVSRIIASKYADGRAYLTLDGHRMDDYNIYVYVTEDYGQTWKPINNGIPDNKGILNVIREDPVNQNLLFAGGEFGAYFSLDRGANWTRIKMNLPIVPVDDIKIHPRDRDLIFGTHGRSIWILDDITPLEQMNDTVANSDFYPFDIMPATNWRVYNHKASTGAQFFIGPNPPAGALINFYLKKPLGEREMIRITISDKDGKPLTTINCGGQAARTAAAAQQQAAQLAAQFGFGGAGLGVGGCNPQPGINRTVWNLRIQPPGGGGGGGRGFGGGGFGGGGASRVDPGVYTVKFNYGGKDYTKTVTVEEDPRIQISDSDRAARRKAIEDLQALQQQASQAQRTVTGIRTAVRNAMDTWRGPTSVPANIRQAAEKLMKDSEAVCKKFASLQQCGLAAAQQLGTAGPALEEQETTISQRIGAVLGQIEGMTVPVNAWQLEQINVIKGLLEPAAQEAGKLPEQLNALNKLMNEAGIPHIRAAGGGGPGGGPPDIDDNDLP